MPLGFVMKGTVFKGRQDIQKNARSKNP